MLERLKRLAFYILISEDKELLEHAHLLLPTNLQPILPCPTNVESVRIYEEHKKMAADYLRIKTELEQLQASRCELAARLATVATAEGGGGVEEQLQEEHQLMEEYVQLQNEKDSLEQFKKMLRQQLEIINSSEAQRQQQQPPQHNNNNQHSNNNVR